MNASLKQAGVHCGRKIFGVAEGLNWHALVLITFGSVDTFCVNPVAANFAWPGDTLLSRDLPPETSHANQVDVRLCFPPIKMLPIAMSGRRVCTLNSGVPPQTTWFGSSLGS